MKIDWAKKLTSRKFWAAIIGFVTPTLLAFGVAQDTVTQVTGIIMSGAVLIAYIIGEGMIDASSLATGLVEVPEGVEIDEAELQEDEFEVEIGVDGDA